MAFESDQRRHFLAERADLAGAAEFGKIDDEAAADDLRAGALQQFDRREAGAACRDQIVHDDDVRRPPSPRRCGFRCGPCRIRDRSPRRARCRAACPSCGSARSRAESWCATAPPRMNPRASMPATLSMRTPDRAGPSRRWRGGTPRGSPNRVVTSRNMIPGFGIVRDRADDGFEVHGASLAESGIHKDIPRKIQRPPSNRHHPGRACASGMARCTLSNSRMEH